MPRSEAIARLPGSGEAVRVRWQNKTIVALDPTKDAPENLWIAPPLVDLQVNGFAGVDFQQDGLTEAGLLHATSALRAAGCTHFLLTLITDKWPPMMRRLQHLREIRSTSDQLRRAITGWHIEGPFLSGEPGFCGAHDPTLMIDPTREHIAELRRITGTDPVLLTIAPERADAIAVISHAVSLGIKVSLGHTNASDERLLEALNVGATGFTHLGNGCPKLLDRHDNILWRVLEALGLTISLIPDRIHVSPALFRIAHKLAGPSAIYYVSDAMAAAGASAGTYRLGRLALEVGDDQIVRLPGSPNFAGSALQPIDGVFRASEMLDCPWHEAWRNFSEVPARFMGWEHGLKVGGAADFCLVEIAEPNRLESLKTYSGGELVGEC